MRILTLLSLALGLFGLAAPAQAGQKKPNVLFIAIDDLNDWVGVLGGHPQARTPNIDRLAKKSLLFTRAYCAAPACNPSRTALLTSLRPSTTGVYHNDQPWRPALPDAVTLPAYLLSHGYLVWGGGKIFHGGYPDAKAWGEYFTGKSKVPNKDLPTRGTGGNMTWGPLQAGDEAMPDTQTTDWAIDKLKQKHDRPFFLAVGYTKPHLAWHAPKKYFDMHPLDKIQLPKVLPNDLDDVPSAGIKMAKPQGDHKSITEAGLWKEAVQAYLACSTFMDFQLGRLLDALEQSGHADNTIVILWSDHGWTHGQKQHWRKFSLWEQDCRVVFMMSAPGVTSPGQRCQRTVNLLDICPTVTELCNLPAKKGMEGHSLVPLLKNPQTAWDHPSITTHGRNNHSIRNEKWRYIRYKDGGEELYDHDNDPLEWKNLAKDPQFAKVKEQLAAHLPKVNAPDAESAKQKKKAKNKGADAFLVPELLFGNTGPRNSVSFESTSTEDKKDRDIFDYAAQKAAKDVKRIVFVADTAPHGPRGNHEFLAAAIYLARSVNTRYPDAYAVVHTKDKWPKDLKHADTIIVLLNHGGSAVNPAVKEATERGAGFMAIHFGVEVNKGDQGQHYFKWIGGYFETFWSVNPWWTPEFKDLPKHEVTRGVKPFAVNDEWYYHMRFVDGMKGVTPILSALPPLKTVQDQGKKPSARGGNSDVFASVSSGKQQVMAWAYDRPDGGRGFGFTGLHKHANLADDGFRTLLLNAVAWVSKLPVPENGVPSRALSRDELEQLIDDGRLAIKERGI